MECGTRYVLFIFDKHSSENYTLKWFDSLKTVYFGQTQSNTSAYTSTQTHTLICTYTLRHLTNSIATTKQPMFGEYGKETLCRVSQLQEKEINHTTKYWAQANEAHTRYNTFLQVVRTHTHTHTRSVLVIFYRNILNSILSILR